MSTFLLAFLCHQFPAGPLPNSTEPFPYFSDRDHSESIQSNDTISYLNVSPWSPFTLQTTNHSAKINESSNANTQSPLDDQYDDPIPAVAARDDNHNIHIRGEMYELDNDMPPLVRSELICIGILFCLFGSILIVVTNILLMLRYN